MSVKDKLKPEQYWEWRNAITDMWLQEAKLKLVSRELEIMQLNQKLVMATKQKEVLVASDQAKSEYNAIKQRLEKYLGQSLDGKVIDDVTFEVKDLNKE